jgi:hypothetical protein
MAFLRFSDGQLDPPATLAWARRSEWYQVDPEWYQVDPGWYQVDYEGYQVDSTP